MIRVGFLGFGNMASAIALSIINSKELSKKIEVFAFDPQNERILNTKGVTYKEQSDLLKICEYVFLAVKPQIMETLLNQIRDNINPNTVFISIAAAISSGYIKNILGENTKLMMVMPNTSLMVGHGATAIANSDDIGFTHFKFVCDIFEQSGEICLIPEEKMNEIIPVSASGIGFMFYFAKQFIEYAIDNGLEEDVTRKMLAQTIIGCGTMLKDSEDDIQTLINNVCSKGGTTIAGIDFLKEKEFEQIVKGGLENCLRRANELF